MKFEYLIGLIVAHTVVALIIFGFVPVLVSGLLVLGVSLILVSPFVFFAYSKYKRGESSEWSFGTKNVQVYVFVEVDQEPEKKDPPKRLDRYA